MNKYEQISPLPTIGKMNIASQEELQVVLSSLEAEGYKWPTGVNVKEILSRVEVLYWEPQRKTLSWSPKFDAHFFDEPSVDFEDHFNINENIENHGYCEASTAE